MVANPFLHFSMRSNARLGFEVAWKFINFAISAQ